MPSLNDWQNRRDTAGVIALLAVAEKFSLKLEACLTGTKIDVAAVHQPFAYIESWQELELIRNMQVLTPSNTHLGMFVGAYYCSDSMGMLGKGMAACQNLVEAGKFAQRYRGFGLAFTEVLIKQSGSHLHIEVLDHAAPDDCREFLICRGIAGAFSLLRDLVGDSTQAFSALQVELMIAEPADPEFFNQYFKVPVQFSALHNRVVLSEQLTTLVLPTANVKNQQMFAKYCDDIQQSLRDRQSVATQVKELLKQSDGVLAADTIAEQLQMSTRSLRRCLQREGKNYRALLLASNMQKADSLLGRGLSVETVAGQLGYSETASFSRAYKAYKGVNPSIRRA